MSHICSDFSGRLMAKNRLDTCVLLVCGTICVIICFLFSDLKGISTDEGIRLGVMNGNMLFSSAEGAQTASWTDVIRSNGTTNYQPLYYLIQNLVIRIAHSHNFVLLKSLNIAFLACC